MQPLIEPLHGGRTVHEVLVALGGTFGVDPRALVRAPRLLLADEPTAGLNVVEREQLLGLLDHVGAERGLAVLMTVPDAPGMLRSQRVASLDRGQLIEPERTGAGGEVIDFPVVRRVP